MAMKLTGANTLENIKIPEAFTKNKIQWMKRLACRIVDAVFLPPNDEDIRTTARQYEAIKPRRRQAANGQAFPYCICKIGKYKKYKNVFILKRS